MLAKSYAKVSIFSDSGDKFMSYLVKPLIFLVNGCWVGVKSYLKISMVCMVKMRSMIFA